MALPTSAPTGTGTPAPVQTGTPAQVSTTTPQAPSTSSSPSSGLTLEQVGSAYKAHYNNPTLSKISDWMMGAKVISDTQKNNPNAPGLSKLAPGQLSRIPTNLDAHLSMLAKAFNDQANPPAQPTGTSDSQAASSFIGGAIPNVPIPGVKNAEIGAVKQALSLPFTTAQLGEHIANQIAKVPGLGWLGTPSGSPADKSIQTPAAFQPNGTAENIGSGAASVGEMFLPGGAESDVMKGISDAVDAGKLSTPLGTLSVDYGKLADAIGPKGADAVKAILKIAGAGLTTGTSMGGVTAAQTGGNPGATAEAAATGGIAGAAGKALETVAPGVMQSLLKSDFKLTPQQMARAPQKIEAAAKFEQANGIVGSNASKLAKLTSLNTDLESTLQKAVPDLKIPTSQIVDSINQDIESLRKTEPAVYSAAKADAKEAISTLTGDGTKNVTAEEALSGKRSWGQRAFKSQRLSTNDPRVAREGAYAVEQAYQSAFSNALDRVASAGTGAVKEGSGLVPIPPKLQSYFGGQSQVSLADFNKVYSDAITSKNLNFVAQFKNDSGLLGRMFGLWAGRAVGNAIAPGLMGEVGGAAAGEILSSRLPGAVRNLAEKGLSMPGSTIPTAAKVVQGGINSQNQ